LIVGISNLMDMQGERLN